MTMRILLFGGVMILVTVVIYVGPKRAWKWLVG